jgi:hypothetical protein
MSQVALVNNIVGLLTLGAAAWCVWLAVTLVREGRALRAAGGHLDETQHEVACQDSAAAGDGGER